MASTWKKKQQNKRLPSQLSESDADFIIGQSRHEAQTENRSNRADGDTSFLKNANSLNQVSSPQVKMNTLEEIIVNNFRSEVDSVMITVEQDAILISVENLVIPRVEIVMKLINASSGRGADSVVLDAC